MSKWPYCTSKWQKLRAAKLSQDPLCRICTLRGYLIEANVVDHITPISKGGPAYPDLDGLMSLCPRCHNEKTAGFDRQGGNALSRRFKGCDADGNPVDPSDGWFNA